MILKTGMNSLTMSVGGRVRKFDIHTPIGYNHEKFYPTVICIKAGLGVGAKWYKDLKKSIDQYQFIGVYPEAIPSDKNRWDLHSMIDVEFITKIRTDYLIGISLGVFAMGISNGGCFVHMMAANSNFLDGICPIAASVYGGMPNTSNNKVSVLQIHGKGDTSVPYLGGQVTHGEKFLAATQSALWWGNENGCSLNFIVKNNSWGDLRTLACLDSSVSLMSVNDSGHNVFGSGTLDVKKSMFDFFDDLHTKMINAIHNDG